MDYIVGIVGKPNVGKSTFFSALTMKTVPIANYPFTTIQPNRGVGYVRVPCVCKEFGVKDEPTNSACINGNRFIPVELVDCAGLVPGAWMGKGLGNMFLDEIRRAKVLIHVVDASGSTDEEGKPCATGTHDPSIDVKFLEEEIDRWLMSIIKKDWSKIVKLTEVDKKPLTEVIAERLSGISVSKIEVAQALSSAGLMEARASEWGDERLMDFTRKVRAKSKPMLIAANKVDIPTAEAYVEKLKGSGSHVVPCSAEAELALKKGVEKNVLSYLPGDGDFEIIGEITDAQRKALNWIKDNVLGKWGSTGVQQALNFSFLNLLGMKVVYPVVDPDKLTDHRGRVLPEAHLVPGDATAKQFAYSIHTELGEHFIYAVEARSSKRVGEDYVLKDGDVISIVSARKRG
ncbi:MAG: redox-regulated ATPase YchF [Candidatus Bathyarchaeia archaeon]